MKTKIWLSPPHMSGNEFRYVNKAFENNWVAPLGPNVDGFEEDIQKYLQIKYAAALNSGTAAIHLALILLGVNQGDEVIVPSFTFAATLNPIIYQKAIPVILDSENKTWNLDPALLETAIIDRIKKRNKPKAIIVVHLYGMPAQIERIMDIANKYDIPVIEDAAEALGSSYKGQKLGSFGTFGVLSFNGNKIITTSGGGALVSNNQEFIEKARHLATQARDKATHYQHSQIGYNYRMSNVIAGIGRGQMEVLESRVLQRRTNNNNYWKLIENVDGVEILKEPGSNYFSNFWLTTILIDKSKVGIDHENLRIAFKKENIDSRPLWKPMHLQPIFKHFPKYLNGVSENKFKNGLCLPSGSNLTDNDFRRIGDVLRQEFNLPKT